MGQRTDVQRRGGMETAPGPHPVQAAPRPRHRRTFRPVYQRDLRTASGHAHPHRRYPVLRRAKLTPVSSPMPPPRVRRAQPMEPGVRERVQAEAADPLRQTPAFGLPHRDAAALRKHPAKPFIPTLAVSSQRPTDHQPLTQLCLCPTRSTQRVHHAFATFQLHTTDLHPLPVSHHLVKTFVHHRVRTSVIVHLVQHVTGFSQSAGQLYRRPS